MDNDEIKTRLERIEGKVDLIVTMQADIKWLKRAATGAWAAILALFGMKG